MCIRDRTTFGKWIAANKKMEFVDTDELIEKENGIKYPENLIDVGIERKS